MCYVQNFLWIGLHNEPFSVIMYPNNQIFLAVVFMDFSRVSFGDVLHVTFFVLIIFLQYQLRKFKVSLF